MKTVFLLLYTLLASAISFSQEKPITKESFDVINLNHSGLGKVKKNVAAAKYEQAATELLQYYRNRTGVRHLDFNLDDSKKFVGKKVNDVTLQLANDILIHKFKPHKGYPTFNYGKNIDWQYRPVKDQLVTTFLHRTAFWEPLGIVYLSTGDERYAKEWVYQLRDWIKKNPQGAYADEKEYAWKAFVVSFRLNHWSGFFNLFLNSPNFTPSFLMEFLNSYHEQADYVMANYTDIGNHLLYEALHMMYAGSMFPEMKQADTWRKSGIAILSREIEKQLLPDGMQFELSPSYHIGTIKTFQDALRIAQLAGVANEFPDSYHKLVERMIMTVSKFSFPDYTFPLYGNSFLTTKATMIKNYKEWAKAFPQNEEIEYFATDKTSGHQPDYTSGGLQNAGFYAFRSGWDEKATVMQIKAGPQAYFHSHPDNGTFELWVKGRNFTPDAGSFIYANVGNQENAKRDWYRSTKAHQTLTLDNKNIQNNASLKKWEITQNPQILTYTNPSYDAFTHQRSFLFVDQSYFIIIDKASGNATGKLGIHFNLKEDAAAAFNDANKSVHTKYQDGNNLLIQCLNTDKVQLAKEESFVSYEYQKEQPRPAFVYEKEKPTTNAASFITIAYPYSGNNVPIITVKENALNNYANDILDLTITINGAAKTIKATLIN